MKKEERHIFQSVFSNLLLNSEKRVNRFIKDNPFTPLIGIARSLLAFATLTVFLFNSPKYIFDKTVLETMADATHFFSYLNLFTFFEWENLIYAKVLVCIILLLVISGFVPKVTCILHWWVAFSLQTGGIILDGGDQINAILTSLLIPIVLSDPRSNHWQKQSKKQPSFYSKVIAHCTFILISLQMSFLYFHSSVEKMYGTAEWVNGTALYYIFNGTFFGLGDKFYSLFQPFIESNFIVVITWTVLLLELYLSYIIMVNREKRKLGFYLGVAFHLSIAFFFGLISFGFSMISGLILYALPYDYFSEKRFFILINKFVISK